MNDARLTDFIERVGTDPHLDVSALVAAGAARGRRLRTRRRAGWVGTTAAVVVIGAGGVALSAGEPGADRVRDLADRSVATSDPSEASPSDTPAGEPPAGPRTFAMEPAETAAVLASILPGPTTQHEVWHGKGFQAGGLLWDSGRVVVLVDTLDAPGLDRGDRARAWCEEGGTLGRCERAEDGTGWVRLWSAEETSGNAPTGIVGNHADLYTDDGFMIAATAYNAASEKDAEPIGPDPVLTPEELAELVTANVWLESPQ